MCDSVKTCRNPDFDFPRFLLWVRHVFTESFLVKGGVVLYVIIGVVGLIVGAFIAYVWTVYQVMKGFWR